jgi:hypothetical protein
VNQALSPSIRWLKSQIATGLPPGHWDHRSLPVRRAASIASAAALSVPENR